MWSSLSFCKQKERREDKTQRGNPLLKCQAVSAILSPQFLFPLSCTSYGSDSAPSYLLHCLQCVPACERDYVGVHVPACGSHSRSWLYVNKHDAESFCFCASRICHQGRRRMKAGCMFLLKYCNSCSWNGKTQDKVKVKTFEHRKMCPAEILSSVDFAPYLWSFAPYFYWVMILPKLCCFISSAVNRVLNMHAWFSNTTVSKKTSFRGPESKHQKSSCWISPVQVMRSF